MNRAVKTRGNKRGGRRGGGGGRGGNVQKKVGQRSLQTSEPLQSAMHSMIQEQLINMMGSNASTSRAQTFRPRLPSKRSRTESTDFSSDEEDSDGEANSTVIDARNKAPAAKKQKPNNTVPSYDAQVVLLDGVHDNLKSNPKKFMNALRTVKPELKVKSVRKTASGAMLVEPVDPKDTNSLLKEDAFPPGSILGQAVKARLPKAQTITHQVVILGLDTDITEEEIKGFLDLQGLPYNSVKRIWSRAKNAPTHMVRLILCDEAKKKHLLKNGMYLDQMKFTCVKAKEDTEKKMAFQCFNCQKWNDHKTFDCKNETKCVICSEPHRKSDCPKQKTEAHCSNCDGNHPAWSTDCPIYQAEIDKKKSFANVTSESMKTPSFMQDLIQPVLLNVMANMKKMISVMIAEVVAHAFLEHNFYEAESRKTNGAKHLGATARVNSIAKKAAQSANNLAFHELDKSTVEVSEVQSMVSERIQSSMNVINRVPPTTTTQKASSSSQS